MNVSNGSFVEWEHPTESGLDQQIWSVKLHPTKPLLATAHADGTVEFRDTRTGEPVGEPLRHESAVQAIAFSHCGELLATAAADQLVRIWRWNNRWQRVNEFSAQTATVQALDFSPDDRILATASNSGEARLLDVETGLPCGKGFRATHYATSVRFSPDGFWLAVGSWDKKAHVWKLPSFLADADAHHLRLRVWVSVGARVRNGEVEVIPWHLWQQYRDELAIIEGQFDKRQATAGH